ncbi:MAG TPA: sigma-70 family RNA polymerase sigma factor [Anaerolineaceae bacterium]
MFGRQNHSKDAPPFFAALFEQYKNLVYKTAFLMLGEVEEAEEALQEVFVLVYRSLDSYNPQKGALTTWLHRITVNYCLGQRRKLRPDWLPVDEELAESSSFTDPDFSALSEREAMIQAIRQLGEKLQVVVILRYYWELPYAEIAQILEIPLGTVKSRIDLAIRSLRQILTGQAETSAPVLPLNSLVQEEVRRCRL